MKLKDYEIVVSKYEIYTCEKEDSLGEKMKLKDLLDLYWNLVNVYKNDELIYSAFKDTEGNYILEDSKDFSPINDKEILNKEVLVDEDYDCDCENMPIVGCKLL